MDMRTTLGRNNVTVSGADGPTLILAHGFGCDQSMWRFLTPHLAARFRLVAFDYVGCGRSDLKAFSPDRYASLEGYARDIVDVAEAVDAVDAVLVGHSVSAMTGLIAATKAPRRIAKLAMVCPSPCFLNDPPRYLGGFERADLEELVALMDRNYIGWANRLAPLVTGLDGEALTEELAGSFCSTDPLFAKTFARATFFSDCRHLLPEATQPTLILQSEADALASVSVGESMRDAMPDARLEVVPANGHCLHMTHAEAIAPMIERFALR